MTLRDHIRVVDGPLAGRVFQCSATPNEPLDIAAAVAPDGTILGVQGEPTPVGVPFKMEAFHVAPMKAKDGHQSRDDSGCLLFYAAAAES